MFYKTGRQPVVAPSDEGMAIPVSDSADMGVARAAPRYAARGVFPVQLIVALSTVLVVGCGTGHNDTAVQAGRTVRGTHADQTLAQRSVVLPSALARGWKQTRHTNDTALEGCQTHNAIYLGLDARAYSPTLTYQSWLKLGIGSYVYADDAAARKALPIFTATPTQTCVARTTVSFLRNARYAVGQPRVAPGASLRIGDQALTRHVAMLAYYSGREFTIRLDTTAVRHARVIDVLSTVAEVPREAAGKLNRALTVKLKTFAAALQKILTVAQRGG